MTIKVKAFLFSLLFMVITFNVFAFDLNLIVEHEMKKGKVFIKGITNLPPGTKLGVDLSSRSGGYSAQSYNIFVKHDGSFSSEGFTEKGMPLSGNYTAEIITYLNGVWQNKEILEKLAKYSGYGIESGKMLVGYDFSLKSPTASYTNGNGKKYPLKHEALVQDFCYALQATMICEDLNMRVDTERKIENEVGMKIRGSESPYNQACMKGLTFAFKDEKHGICSKAWKKFGCYGNKVPRLIQENPFRKKNGVFCEY